MENELLDDYCCVTCILSEFKEEGVCYCTREKDFVPEDNICDYGVFRKCSNCGCTRQYTCEHCINLDNWIPNK